MLNLKEIVSFFFCERSRKISGLPRWTYCQTNKEDTKQSCYYVAPRMPIIIYYSPIQTRIDRPKDSPWPDKIHVNSGDVEPWKCN